MQFWSSAAPHRPTSVPTSRSSTNSSRAATPSPTLWQPVATSSPAPRSSPIRRHADPRRGRLRRLAGRPRRRHATVPRGQHRRPAHRPGQARPDVVLDETGGYAVAVAAHAWGSPPRRVAGDRRLGGLSLRTVVQSPAWQPFGPLRRLVSRHGMPRSAGTMGFPEHGLVLIPRIAARGRQGRPHQQFVGPCLDQQRLTETFTPTDSDRRILYVAFGTAYTDGRICTLPRLTRRGRRLARDSPPAAR